MNDDFIIFFYDVYIFFIKLNIFCVKFIMMYLYIFIFGVRFFVIDVWRCYGMVFCEDRNFDFVLEFNVVNIIIIFGIFIFIIGIFVNREFLQNIRILFFQGFGVGDLCVGYVDVNV